MHFTESAGFLRDYAKLNKRFRSLGQDFAKLKVVLADSPRGNGGKHWSILYDSEFSCIFKTRMSCDYLKRSSLRVIYAYVKNTPRIEFIELYFKGDKESEDRGRIKEYLKKF